jgi:hypothetical protein
VAGASICSRSARSTISATGHAALVRQRRVTDQNRESSANHRTRDHVGDLFDLHRAFKTMRVSEVWASCRMPSIEPPRCAVTIAIED